MHKATTALVLILIATLIIFGFNLKPSGEINTDPVVLITLDNLVEIKPVPAVDSFGFEKSSYSYSEGRIQRNENLYLILRRQGLSPQEIYTLQQTSSGVANLNRMMPGQKYRIYFNEEEEPVSFVWQQSNLQYVSLSWEDEMIVERGEIPVRKQLNEASGIINNSLYQSIVSQGISSYVGSELADIFAWEIDFFALRRGDHYKVIYEELVAGGEVVGIGRVVAAEFQHRGDVNRAYYFENGERMGYFDPEGNSLEKELLKAPFRYNQPVSSGFSSNRFHPILRQNRPHYGTDYAAPTGTPVLSVGDGVVTEAQRRGGNGNIVQIRHNNRYRTAYLHLSRFAEGIRPGVEVRQGQVIGYVGQTGLATGPHLCYRLYRDDRPVNSVSVDLPAAESLERRHLSEFRTVVNRLNDLLNDIQLVDKIAQN